MEEHNGWKNQVTWVVNVFAMPMIERMLQEGETEEEIQRELSIHFGYADLTLLPREIFMCAWKTIDWYTLFARAKENIKGDNNE